MAIGANFWMLMVIALVGGIVSAVFRGRSLKTGPWNKEISSRAYPQFPSVTNTHSSSIQLNSWVCLKRNCRNQNVAGARFCSRCGATRGYTYRSEQSEEAAD
ncbi:MAG TPA: hypothetical protein P5081_00310 [Phycisphaerae bacterium]|nr:hypothetical protein [Phycisphaerae bacterium]HRW51295.1 hypothetical protein [Phycisphaerae bacterium]